MGTNMGPPNQLPPVSMQFRPMAPIPPQPSPVPPFAPVSAQQYQPGGHPNMGMPMLPPAPIQYHPPMQPPFHHPSSLPQPPLQHHMRPPAQSLTAPGHLHSQGPAVPPPDMQPNRPVMPGSGPPLVYNNMIPNSSGPRFSHGQPVQIAPAPSQADPPNFPGVQSWYPTVNQQMQMVLPTQQVVEQPKGDQEGFSGATQSMTPSTSSLSNGDQNPGQKQFSDVHTDCSGTHFQPNEDESAGDVSNMTDSVKEIPADSVKVSCSDWGEYTSPQGKKYYYNKRTRISSWEKPLDLMTPIERADASTDWREVTAPDGRRFYFNKVTRKSTWVFPDELKLARERANLAFSGETNADTISNVGHVPGNEASDADGIRVSPSDKGVAPLKPENGGDPHPAAAPELSAIQEVAVSTAVTPPAVIPQTVEKALPEGIAGAFEVGDGSTPEGKTADRGYAGYESKEDAKTAFRTLLETANIGPDWTWDQAMRLIINDRRYGALKSLGERKQAFNEFLSQRKKMEAEEKRARQRRAKEDFKIMLQECKDLTSSTRWSKAISVLERDDRFQAVERSKDREELFEAYIEELRKKERAKAMEEHKRYIADYLEFLKSCDFIKASSQWRKVQHRLEADERCSRLEKIERLEIFQEYVQELEMEEEEQRKLRIEETRRAERRNRDEFRKLMEEHATAGFLTVNSHWREYAMKVKENPAYISVSSNTSGPTAKDLFDDVIEDLEKQYLEDKERVEEAIMNEKISLSPTWSLEDFKSALSEDNCIKRISDANMKIIFNELLEFKRERDGKEAKRRKRHADDVYEFLLNLNELTSSSKWEDCRAIVEERFIGEESFFRGIFGRVIERLKEKEKHKENKRKEGKKQERRFKEYKEKERRHKDGYRNDKERRKMEETDSEGSRSSSFEEKKRSRDRTKRYERQDDDSLGDMSQDDDKYQFRSHRYTFDMIKLKQDKHTEVDSENESKRQRRDDHWNPPDPELQNFDGAEEGEVQ